MMKLTISPALGIVLVDQVAAYTGERACGPAYGHRTGLHQAVERRALLPCRPLVRQRKCPCPSHEALARPFQASRNRRVEPRSRCLRELTAVWTTAAVETSGRRRERLRFRGDSTPRKTISTAPDSSE
jgi:hypothetical protein